MIKNYSSWGWVLLLLLLIAGRFAARGRHVLSSFAAPQSTLRPNTPASSPPHGPVRTSHFASPQ